MGKNCFMIIDQQKDFNLEGAPYRVDCGLEALPYIKKALEASRAAGIPVVHVFRYYRADGSDVELTRYFGFHQVGGGCVPGTEGAEECDEIKPIEGEYLVVKQRWSAFFQTECDMLLRRLGVTQIIVSGVQTPNCVRGTVWDANSLDYEVIVLTDATGAKTPEVHQANLFDMKNIGIKMMTTDEYCEALKTGGPASTLIDEIRKDMAGKKITPEPVVLYK